MNKKDFGYNTDCCCLTEREISTLVMKENQALKDRWNKLKEFVKHEQICVDDGFQEVFNAYRQVLDKMQELEQDNK